MPTSTAGPAASRPEVARSAPPHLPEATRQRLEDLLNERAPEPPPTPPPAPPAASADRAAGALPGRETLMISRSGELWAALATERRAFLATGLFSLVINVLMLAGPLFMLQVYDRVMASGSIATLIVLAALTALAYGAIGYLELVRGRIVVRIGIGFDRAIADRVFNAALRRSVKGQATSVSALRELDGIRQFISGQGPITFYDAPWTPFYLLIVFLLHWTLGVAALIGAAVLLVIAWAGEAATRGPLQEAGKTAALSLELAETGQRNAEAITAMGMTRTYRSQWQQANGKALAWQVQAADRLSSTSSVSKTLRLLMQSMMLAIGAALALSNEISAGTIVAATIIFGRALAPVEQMVGHWRAFIKAAESYRKLDELLRTEAEPAQRTSLPAPKGHLEVSALRVAAPETRQLILSSVTFSVAPGQMLAIIGPSASGKSSLARALVGLWPAFSGSIRLDGARLDQWDADELGRHIGYLPQTVELFAGSVRSNIARFQHDATDEEIIAAAMAAHAHELILALPQGYETPLGAFGTYLSAGQRQRIGLARALFRHPALVVLDEPNSNLDRVGDEALAAAIDGMRARGQAVVLVSHRVQAIGKADLILYLDRGMQRAFGPRDEVLRMIHGQPNPRGEPPVADRRESRDGGK